MMSSGSSAGVKAGSQDIVFDGVEKWYGDLNVFADINLTVKPGEILSLVGPSGCGKTTLLRCINGLVKADGGEIRVGGEPITGPRPNIAIVFQDFGLFPWKTVLGNVGYGLKVRGHPKDEVDEVARRYIRMVGLEGRENAYPYQLSGGMQQRTGLARALSVDPGVLLMDEPFGALDAQTRELLQYELLDIWQQSPTTMVFVTHAIDEAVLMGDRVAVMMGSPSKFAEIVDVPLPRPRDEATVASPEFQELRRYVWDLVMGAQRVVRDEAHLGD